jgi:AcrR family transcriptional regulator
LPKIVNKTEKRQMLVQAAIPIFAKNGFRDTKMSDIAISADVGKGTLYEYFESKDDLFLNAFKLWFNYFSDQMQEIVQKESDPLSQLITFFDQYFQTIEEYSDIYFIYFDFWSELTRNQKLDHEEISTVYESLRDLFSTILEEGVTKGSFSEMECSTVSTALVALADGLLMQWLLDRSSFSIRDVGLKIMTSYLESLKK